MEVAFVLVEPKRAENVGAAARAMKTMGFGDLRLVGEALHLEKAARVLAHGSGDVLAAASHYPDLDSAVADCQLVAGASAKRRHHRRVHLSPEELGASLRAQRDSVGRVALVFGREDIGLNNREIARCDVLSQIPLASPQPSLNLAQAVMLFAYALCDLRLLRPTAAADPGQLARLQSRVRALLDRSGIGADDKAYGWAMERLALSSDEDVAFLHFICGKVDTSSNDRQ